MKKISSGFTLMELMITLAIVSILAAVAVPSMRVFIQNERLVTQINSLLSHLQYARSEAITRHQQVVVCASSNASSCTGDWSDGWIMFYDLDSDGAVSGTDEILKVKDALKGDTTLSTSTGSDNIVYDDRGFSPGSNVTFSLCDARGNDFGKSISISVTGRIRNGGVVSC